MGQVKYSRYQLFNAMKNGRANLNKLSVGNKNDGEDTLRTAIKKKKCFVEPKWV